MLRWTDDKPTEPGWYWWRDSDTVKPMAVEVYSKGPFHPGSVVYAEHWSDGEVDAPVAKIDGQWAGPIPEPLEPDECEHRVSGGDWCEPCNLAYKLAAVENAENVE